MIDIEEELKDVQIKYIRKELEMLRLYYDDYMDFKFLQILCSYEEVIELASSTDETFILYKKMYQSSLNYLFEEIQDMPLSEEELLDYGSEYYNDKELPF